MSSLDNLVAEILEQAKKEASRMLTKAKAENLEFFEKENKKDCISSLFYFWIKLKIGGNNKT